MSGFLHNTYKNQGQFVCSIYLFPWPLVLKFHMIICSWLSSPARSPNLAQSRPPVLGANSPERQMLNLRHLCTSHLLITPKAPSVVPPPREVFNPCAHSGVTWGLHVASPFLPTAVTHSVPDADSSCLKTSGIKSQDCHSHSRTSKCRDTLFISNFLKPFTRQGHLVS